MPWSTATRCAAEELTADGACRTIRLQRGQKISRKLLAWPSTCLNRPDHLSMQPALGYEYAAMPRLAANLSHCRDRPRPGGAWVGDPSAAGRRSGRCAASGFRAETNRDRRVPGTVREKGAWPYD